MLIFQLLDHFVPTFKCGFWLFIEVVGMTIKYFNELAEPQMLAIPVKAFLQQVQHSYAVLLAFLVKNHSLSLVISLYRRLAWSVSR